MDRYNCAHGLENLDINLPQIDLHIQYNPNQYPTMIFLCSNWQENSKIYIEKQKN